ncbi:MAG: zinc-dependent dehydrogenase [Patescibacteria group bacterium]
MKAATLVDLEDLRLGMVPDPVCEPGGVIVKVGACAVCGTDVKVYHKGHRMLHLPRIIGHEVAGTIVEVGPEAEGLSVGQRVAVAPVVPCGTCHYCRRGITGQCDSLAAIGYRWDGGYAEYMAVPALGVRAGIVNPLPDAVSFAEGALAEPLACAINGQELSRISLGDTVAIIGAGPLGCFHVELARARGAVKVIATEASAARLREAEALAAPDVLIDAVNEDPIARVREETGGRGADAVIVACSSAVAQVQALSMVAKRGSVNFFGGLPKGRSEIAIDSNLIHYGEFTVTGTSGSTAEQNRMALSLIASSRVRVGRYIGQMAGLDGLAEGIRRCERGEGMKTIIVPGDDVGEGAGRLVPGVDSGGR